MHACALYKGHHGSQWACSICVCRPAEFAEMADFAHFAPSQTRGRSRATLPPASRTPKIEHGHLFSHTRCSCTACVAGTWRASSTSRRSLVVASTRVTASSAPWRTSPSQSGSRWRIAQRPSPSPSSLAGKQAIRRSNKCFFLAHIFMQISR